MAFQAKEPQVHQRQLEAQEVIATCDLVAGKSDAPQLVSIDNSTITAAVITIDIQEPIAKCFFAEVRNRATGAIVALAAAPSLATAKKISVTVNGTGLSDVAVRVVYKVAE